MIRNKRRDDKSKICDGINDLQKSSIPRKFWAQAAKWGYDKKPLTCNDLSDKNDHKSVKKTYMELLFILNKPLVRLLNCKAVNSHPKFKKNVTIFGKYRIFL